MLQSHHVLLPRITHHSVLLHTSPDWAATVAWLKGMGADVVTTEQKLKEDLGEQPAQCVEGCVPARLVVVVTVTANE
jgi:hypothetical protein